jgi:hypothetical protein
LRDFSVGGLAAHLAAQIFFVPQLLAGSEPPEEPITVLDHYAQAQWIKSGVDDEPNVSIRRGGEAAAVQGAEALALRAEATVSELRLALFAEPGDRVVHLPWTQWSLRLDDFLITRMMELAVHSDDLAVSVGVGTPPLTPAAVDTVTGLLTRLAVRRHGPTAVIRTLSRAERAPITITAF